MTSIREVTNSRPWYSHVTIDLFATVLSRSLFHPFVAWMFPLSLRAVGSPYHSTEFIVSSIYATTITAIWMLGMINRRVAYGLPRELDWDEEVVLITGGASGLGKLLAQTYGMRGASVVILDVIEPESESEGMDSVHFIRCDIGNEQSLEQAKQEIEKLFGNVTILVNNAGVVNAKRLWELSPAQLRRNFDVNLISHFHTIRTFLPNMLSRDIGGTIVTISSVLGKLGANYLSDYTAAKAGLIAMHASLRAELASPSAPEGAENIRTILVTPGQLSTALFADVQTPSNFLGPVVEPVDLVKEIVKLIDAGESGEISLPLYAQYIEWLDVLPLSLQKMARWLSGVDIAMERVHGKKRQ